MSYLETEPNITKDEEDFFYSNTRETLDLEHNIYLIWGVMSIVPNVLLICIFIKYQLCRANFYFIIGNWSLANIFQIVYGVLFPMVHVSYQVMDILKAVYWIISTVPVIFALLLIFDFFVNSKKRCLYTVYNIWMSTLVNVSVIVAAKIWGFTRSLTPTDVIIIGSLSFAILIIRSVVHCIRSSQDKHYPLRLTMATFCVSTNFSISLHLISTIFSTMFIQDTLYNISKYVVTTNGFINLLLLVNFDQDIKSGFCQLFGCKRKQFNVQFSVRKSIESKDRGFLGDEENKV